MGFLLLQQNIYIFVRNTKINKKQEKIMLSEDESIKAKI